MYHHTKHIAQPSTFHTAHGLLVAVRQAAAADALLITDLLRRLSKRTFEFRYMSPRPFSSEAIAQEAARMAQGNTHHHVTLLATVRHDGHDEVIGVGELVRDSQMLTAGEIGLVVRDDEQKQGIGGFLIRQLVYAAQRIGITQLHGDLLAENRAMRRLIFDLGLPHTATVSHGEITVIIYVREQFEATAVTKPSRKLAA